MSTEHEDYVRRYQEAAEYGAGFPFDPSKHVWHPGDPVPNRLPTDCKCYRQASLDNPDIVKWYKEPTDPSLWTEESSADGLGNRRWPYAGNEDVYGMPEPADAAPVYSIPIDCPDGYDPVAYRVPKEGEQFVVAGNVKTATHDLTYPHLVVLRKEWKPKQGNEAFQVDICSVGLYDYEAEDGPNYWLTEEAATNARKAAHALWATLDHETGQPKEIEP